MDYTSLLLLLLLLFFFFFLLFFSFLALACKELQLIFLQQVEKPFGKDLQSSRGLAKALAPNWKEDEIFRIDHYLGKEMVKNILIMRFGNEFFNATWNRHHIDNIQVCSW